MTCRPYIIVHDQHIKMAELVKGSIEKVEIYIEEKPFEIYAKCDVEDF